MASLTVGQLRTLARLVRANVDGAAEALADIALADLPAVATVIGRPSDELTRLTAHELAALLAMTAVTTSSRPSTTPEQSRCAAELGATAVERGGRAHALDPKALVALVRHLKGPAVRLGSYGAVKAPLLRAVVHALRGVELLGVVVSDERLTLTYSGRHCRGTLRLRLEQRPQEAHDVVVSFLTAEAAWISCDLPVSEPHKDRPPPSPPARPFLVVVLDAIADTWRSR